MDYWKQALALLTWIGQEKATSLLERSPKNHLNDQFWQRSVDQYHSTISWMFMELLTFVKGRWGEGRGGGGEAKFVSASVGFFSV